MHSLHDSTSFAIDAALLLSLLVRSGLLLLHVLEAIDEMQQSLLALILVVALFLVD